MEQLQKESRGNATNKSIINTKKNRFLLTSANLISLNRESCSINLLFFLELNIRLTELGNKFGDVDADLKTLQTADQGK